MIIDMLGSSVDRYEEKEGLPSVLSLAQWKSASGGLAECVQHVTSCFRGSGKGTSSLHLTILRHSGSAVSCVF